MFGELILLGVLLLMAIIFLSNTFLYPEIAAAVPRIFLVVLIILIVIEIFLFIKKGKLSLPAKISWKEVRDSKKIITVVATIVYIAAIQVLGFYIATISMLISLPYFLGPANRFQLIANTGVIAGIIYVIFTVLLKMRLPAGIISGF